MKTRPGTLGLAEDDEGYSLPFSLVNELPRCFAIDGLHSDRLLLAFAWLFEGFWKCRMDIK